MDLNIKNNNGEIVIDVVFNYKSDMVEVLKVVVKG